MRRASFSCKNTNFPELRQNIIFLIFLFYLLLPIIVIALITGSLLRQGFTKRLSIRNRFYGNILRRDKRYRIAK